MREQMERKAYRCDGKICDRISIHIPVPGCSVQQHHLPSEKVQKCTRDQTDDDNSSKSRMNISASFVRTTGALTYAEVCSCSDAEEHADAGSERDRREDYIRSGIPQHADHMSDEDLISHIISSAHQHTDDRRYRIPCYQ